MSAGRSRLLIDLGWPGMFSLLAANLAPMDIPLQEITHGVATNIINMAHPVNAQDAATKNYVDTNAANISLSNLGTTAINQDLVPNSDAAINIGSQSLRFLTVNAQSGDSGPSSNLSMYADGNIELIPADTYGVNIYGGTTAVDLDFMIMMSQITLRLELLVLLAQMSLLNCRQLMVLQARY